VKEPKTVKELQLLTVCCEVAVDVCYTCSIFCACCRLRMRTHLMYMHLLIICIETWWSTWKVSVSLLGRWHRGLLTAWDRVAL